MTNFEAQMAAAIDLYSEISGKPADVIAAECADTNSATAKIISLLMFAAR